jgi:hypothetical protein
MIAWKREITHLIFIVEKFDVEKKKDSAEYQIREHFLVPR